MGAVTIPENWKDALPEEFRKERSLESIKSVEDLTKSFLHAQKMIGRDKVVIPDQKLATDADWKAFYGKLGMPADAKDFKVEAPKGVEIDQDFFNAFKDTAFKMNILPAQAQKLMDWYAVQEKQAMEGAKAHALQQVQSNLEAYKKLQGRGFERKVQFANRALEHLAPPETIKKFAENPALGSMPELIDLLAKAGEQLFTEDSFEGADKFKGHLTPDEARQRRNELMADQAGPYWNKMHPNHQKAVDEVNKLFEMELG